jgi:hypothetical protein
MVQNSFSEASSSPTDIPAPTQDRTNLAWIVKDEEYQSLTRWDMIPKSAAVLVMTARINGRIVTSSTNDYPPPGEGQNLEGWSG